MKQITLKYFLLVFPLTTRKAFTVPNPETETNFATVITLAIYRVDLPWKKSIIGSVITVNILQSGSRLFP